MPNLAHPAPGLLTLVGCEPRAASLRPSWTPPGSEVVEPARRMGGNAQTKQNVRMDFPGVSTQGIVFFVGFRCGMDVQIR